MYALGIRTDESEEDDSGRRRHGWLQTAPGLQFYHIGLEARKEKKCLLSSPALRMLNSV